MIVRRGRQLLLLVAVLVGSSVGVAGCVGCPWRGDGGQVTDVTSDQVTLVLPQPEPKPVPLPPAPEPKKAVPARVAAPELAPVRATEPAAEPPVPEDVLSELSQSGPPPVPPGTYQADDLTMRLREKMAEAYGGDMGRVPQATIYLSNGSLEEFIEFYEERGYRVQRISVPVNRILQPVLRDKPELEDRIRLEDYEGVVIHQAMVEGTGVSAADRYIDPDTYDVIERLFVTEMPLR